MEYWLFTYPNCEKCNAFKEKLKGLSLSVKEVDLVKKEGKAKLREFLDYVRRDERGAIVLPLLIVLNEGRVEVALNNPEELEAWWRSRV
ncbi:MAG: glutaredoxin [Candidatus Aminicenantes bacterium]|nr:glutaredoxin [Candidatus Aminicenantes bacterium]